MFLRLFIPVNPGDHPYGIQEATFNGGPMGPVISVYDDPAKFAQALRVRLQEQYRIHGIWPTVRYSEWSSRYESKPKPCCENYPHPSMAPGQPELTCEQVAMTLQLIADAAEEDPSETNEDTWRLDEP